MRSGAKWRPKHYRLTRQICGRFVHFVETGLPQTSISVVFSSLESGWGFVGGREFSWSWQEVSSTGEFYTIWFWRFFLDTLGTFRPCLNPQKNGGTVAIGFRAKQASDVCFQSTNLSCPQNRLVSCKSQEDFRSGSCLLYLLKSSWGLKFDWCMLAVSCLGFNVGSENIPRM